MTATLLIHPFQRIDYLRLSSLISTMNAHSTTQRIVSWSLAYLALQLLAYWGMEGWRRTSVRARIWAACCSALLAWTLTIPGSDSDGHTWYGTPASAWGSVRLRFLYASRWLALTVALTLVLSRVFAHWESGAGRTGTFPGAATLRRLRFAVRPVAALAGILFVCWIPILLIDGPIHIFIDTTEQITMYRERRTLEWMGFLRTPGSWLNDQHPFVDTLLYGFVDDIGRAIGNEVLAFAALTWIQTACCALALAALVCWIASRTAITDVQLALILFVCALVPVFPLNMAIVMKDATWMPFFICWLVAFCELVRRVIDRKPLGSGVVSALIVFSILAGVTKKTSSYLTLVSTLAVLLAMIRRPARGKASNGQPGGADTTNPAAGTDNLAQEVNGHTVSAHTTQGIRSGHAAHSEDAARPAVMVVQILAAALAAPVLVLGILPATLYGPLRISQGSPAEYLAVPMQQVTKAFLDHGREISEADRKVVERTMDLRKAERAFRPSSSNTGVKGSYGWAPGMNGKEPARRGSAAQSRSVARRSADRPDTLQFLAVWARLGLRYPHSYVSAVPYLWDAFVPGRVISRGFGPMRSGKHAQHIFLTNIKVGSYSWGQRVIGRPVMTVLATVPPFCVLADISFYTVWVPLLGLMECVMRRRWRQLVLLVPTALLLAIQLVIQVAEVRLSLGLLCVFPVALAAAWVGSAGRGARGADATISYDEGRSVE